MLAQRKIMGAFLQRRYSCPDKGANMEFQKISSPSLRELFVEQLEHMILSGKLAVGEKLPPERQLAETMQISRSVVNGGISDLEKKGFLVVKPRSGTYVADYRRNGTADTLLAIMNYNGGKLRAEEIRSILEVRIALDTLAAELCEHHITEEEISVLEEIIETLKNAPTIEDAVEAAYEFQHEFAIFSGNTLIPLIFCSFKVAITSLWERFCLMYGIEALYENNFRLFTYIKNRDAKGAADWIEKSVRESIDGSRKIYYD